MELGFLDMTKTIRSTVGMGLALGLGALAVSGCGLGVLSRPPSPDAAQDTAPPPLTVCDPANLPSPGCAQTCADAQAILSNDCGACHSSGYNGNLNRVMDYHGLVNVEASSKYPGLFYVVPGDPENSLLYERIITREMPPTSSDVTSQLPRPSVSDTSILYEWIKSCVPNLPGPDAGTPPPPTGDAGVDGSGPYVLTTCPTAPPAGACSIQGMVCPYPTQTCTCSGTAWDCLSCPTAQPANGGSCPVAVGQAGAVPFECAYGNVTCDCVGNLDQTLPPTWSCGVCPATEPSNGQACGNTSISCPYDRRRCDCVAGTWGCQGLSCGVSNMVLTVPTSCSGFYSCDYPGIDQACTCSGTLNDRATLACTCPTTAPRIGAFCQKTMTPCGYSDQTCSCQYGGWQCTQQCPGARPTDGSACSSSLNCSYSGGLCYCDGSIWHCS